MVYFRKKDYAKERERPKPLAHYKESMIRYLHTLHPTVDMARIEQFVIGIIERNYKPPMVNAVVHKREGFSDNVTVPLDKYIQKVIKDNNLTPSGSVYYPVSKKESFLRKSIAAKVAARNAFKKKYLAFEAQGLKQESDYYKQQQDLAKIFNNAIAGGMKIDQFILGSKAGFNAITSIGRICVKQGYSVIERAVAGNIYLPTMEATLSYIINHIRAIPDGFDAIIENKLVYIPSIADVVTYLRTSMENYIYRPDMTNITKLLNGLSTVELSYIFYAGCFYNLCYFNDKLVRSFVDACFTRGDIPEELWKDIPLTDLDTIHGDTISCILVTNYQHLGKKPGGDKWNSPKEAKDNNPDGLRKFIYCCKVFTKAFEEFLPILKPIMAIETTFSKLTFQHHIARKAVPLSDTDSNIFTLQEMINWRQGEINFEIGAYEMCALTTMILSQSLEHIFARLTAGIGAENEDVFRTSMKNEFLYPAIMTTSMGKHYLAIATIQEGALLANPREDFKGVGFKSSTYPAIIKEGFNEFTRKFFKNIWNNEDIFVTDILEHISNQEHLIAKSLNDRESIYLQTVPIKYKNEYADPDKSPYFYYELWQAVFAERYGDMVIPNKCFKIPLVYGDKTFSNAQIMEHIENNYPDIYEKLVTFMAGDNNRKISAILLPPFKGRFDQFFLDVMNIRTLVAQSMAAYYNFLDGLGVGTVDKRIDALVSDFIDPSRPLIDTKLL